MWETSDFVTKQQEQEHFPKNLIHASRILGQSDYEKNKSRCAHFSG